MRVEALLSWPMLHKRSTVRPSSPYERSWAPSPSILLDQKDEVADELNETVAPRLKAFGLELVALGIRDVILPGEMKDLLNKVTEAKKAAEANLITRREETAAVRAQLNAARILESNPTLMRLRELEVLEKVTDKANLNVILGDKGLADKVIKLAVIVPGWCRGDGCPTAPAHSTEATCYEPQLSPQPIRL